MLISLPAVAMGIALQPVPPELCKVVTIKCNDCKTHLDAAASALAEPLALLPLPHSAAVAASAFRAASASLTAWWAAFFSLAATAFWLGPPRGMVAIYVCVIEERRRRRIGAWSPGGAAGALMNEGEG